MVLRSDQGACGILTQPSKSRAYDLRFCPISEKKRLKKKKEDPV